jgi:uncharacterized protein YndB with AHSA1/START domain
VNTGGDDTIFIEYKFNADAGKIWKAWTEPLLIRQWFGSDPDGKVLNAEMDVRPGGGFEITFKDSDGTVHTCCGVYKDVQPNSRLSFTWMWRSEPGIQSFVTILFVPNGSNTMMQFEHVNVGYTSAHNYAKGWKDTFRKLEERLVK